MICNECKMDVDTRKWKCVMFTKDMNTSCHSTSNKGVPPPCYVTPPPMEGSAA